MREPVKLVTNKDKADEAVKGHIVEAAERLLEAAKAGKIHTLGIVAQSAHGNGMVVEWAGCLSLTERLGSLEALKISIYGEAILENASEKATDPEY